MTDAVEVFLGEIKCELQRFEPKPGDIFVLTIPDEISLEHIDRMRSDWARVNGSSLHVAVLGGGVRIQLTDARENNFLEVTG